MCDCYNHRIQILTVEPKYHSMLGIDDETYVVQCNEICGLFKAEKPVNEIYLKILKWESPQGISHLCIRTISHLCNSNYFRITVHMYNA